MPRLNPPPDSPPPPFEWTPPPGWYPAQPPPPPGWRHGANDEGTNTRRIWWIRGVVATIWLIFLISAITSGGVGSFLFMIGLPVSGVGVAAAIRGGARWAWLVGRQAAWIAAGAGLFFMIVGGAVGTSTTPVSVQARSMPSATTPPPIPTESASSTDSPTSTVQAHQAVIVAGAVVPDTRITPGSAFAGVTTKAVCSSTWTVSHSAVDRITSDRVYAAYGVTQDQRALYELDHLIPVELGGDSSLANLWPDPITAPVADGGAVAKDRLESHLRALVCAGTVALGTAQHDIATNWATAYAHYTPIQVPRPPAPAPPPVHTQQAPAPAPTHAVPPPPADPIGATAQCVDLTYSYSQHRRGTCSHHHGVLRWINRPPS